jgi:hypothetical protein
MMDRLPIDAAEYYFVFAASRTEAVPLVHRQRGAIWLLNRRSQLL